MMIGFFEGLDSERGIASRLADSLTLRQFLSSGMEENTPDHVTISRTRRLIDGETHQRIFTWVLERLAQGGSSEARPSAWIRPHGSQRGNEIDRAPHSGESYMAYLQRLAEAEGIEPKRGACSAWIASARRNSNEDWKAQRPEPRSRN